MDGVGWSIDEGMYRLEHENLRRLADSLAEAAARSEFSLTTRPWNRFEPDETEWWLVPGPEWPAYKYGKLFLHWTDRKKRRARAALHVEKGLGREVGPAYDARRGRRLIMDDAWAWHSLVEALADGRFGTCLSELRRRSAGRVELVLEAGYVPDPDSFDPYAYDFGRDSYIFSLTDDEGSLALADVSREAGLLEGFERVRSIDELASNVSPLSREAWIWVDFMAGVPLQLDVDPDHGRPVALATELWSGFEVFRPWLRSAR